MCLVPKNVTVTSILTSKNYYPNSTILCWQVLVEHECPVLAVAIQVTDVVSGSEKGEIIVWDLSIGDPRHRLRGHTESITTIRLTNDGLFAVSGRGTHIYRLNVLTFAFVYHERSKYFQTCWLSLVELCNAKYSLASGYHCKAWLYWIIFS